jgi:hypothetical protein
VESGLQLVGQCGVNHPLAVGAGHSRENGGDDFHPEMAFPTRPGAGMADMKVGFIDNVQSPRRQCLGQLPLYRSGNLHFNPSLARKAFFQNW